MFHREAGVFKTTYAADMALYPLPIAKRTVAVLAILFVFVLPAVLGEYQLSILNLMFIAIVGALGLNILVGYTGQISLGHGAFMSVGAYTAANLAVKTDFDSIRGDVLNVLPPMRAADIARSTGLVNANNRWCGVDWRTMESTAVKGVHVLGDATLSAPAMPKSGSMANQHAKICAAAIVAQLERTAGERV